MYKYMAVHVQAQSQAGKYAEIVVHDKYIRSQNAS